MKEQQQFDSSKPPLVPIHKNVERTKANQEDVLLPVEVVLPACSAAEIISTRPDLGTGSVFSVSFACMC